MKITAKLVCVLGVAAGAGLFCVTGGMASPADQEKAAAAKAPITGEWGSTEILSAEPVKRMFSHKMHVGQIGLTCDACHPDVFQKKIGAAAATGEYTMASFAEGKFCGACHNGKVAADANNSANCTQCHAEPPKVVVFEKPVKAVIFDHSAHVTMGLDCASCHNEVFKMELGAAEQHPDKFTMEALYRGEYCGACHDGQSAFASNTRCTSCHIGVRGFDRMFGAPKDSSHGGGHH